MFARHRVQCRALGCRWTRELTGLASLVHHLSVNHLVTLLAGHLRAAALPLDAYLECILVHLRIECLSVDGILFLRHSANRVSHMPRPCRCRRCRRAQPKAPVSSNSWRSVLVEQRIARIARRKNRQFCRNMGRSKKRRICHIPFGTQCLWFDGYHSQLAKPFPPSFAVAQKWLLSNSFETSSATKLYSRGQQNRDHKRLPRTAGPVHISIWPRARLASS